MSEQVNEASRIKLLEEQLRLVQAENESLRAELGKKKRQAAFPDDILREFPALEGVFYKRNENPMRQKEFSAIDAVCAPLSRIIRGTLFPETAVSYHNSEKYIVCQDMSVEQYGAFRETLRGILSALQEGRKQAADAANPF